MALTITRKANDKKAGMTLGDLRDVVAEAERAGLTEDAQVRVTAGWRAQLTSVEVSA